MPKGGARPGAGRKKNQPESHGAPRKSEATEIIQGLGTENGHAADCLCWKCLWRRDAQREDVVGFNARKYLWDRADGKPVDTVNHLHDKPLQVEATISIAEVVREVRQRKQEYERSGR